MKYSCCEEDTNWLLLEDQGYLQRYQCKICGEEICVHGDFPIVLNAPPQSCKIYVEWSKEISLVSPDSYIKKLASQRKKYR